MSRSRPRTFHFSQQFQRLSSYEEFTKLDQAVQADSTGVSQHPQCSIEASIREESYKQHAIQRSSVSPTKHLSQEQNKQFIKSPDIAVPNGITVGLKDSQQLQGQNSNLTDKIPVGAENERDNTYQGYSYFRMPFEQQPFQHDSYELCEEDLSFLLEFNQKTKRKAHIGQEGDNQLEKQNSSLKEISPEDMTTFLVYFENRSTRGTTATVQEVLFEIPEQIQKLMNEEELILFYEYWKNQRQNQEQFRQGEPNAPKEICPLLRKFWRATIEEKSSNQTFRPHVSQKMNTRKTTRPESEIHERLLQLQADFDKHRMLFLKLKKREQIKREIAFVSITDFNSSIPGLSAAFSIQNKFTSHAQEIRNISNMISPKSQHKTQKHPKNKTHDVPQKDSQLQPLDDQATISPNRGQSDKMSGTVMAGISRSKEDQNNKVEDNQKGEDLGVDIINGENKKKKKNPKKILLEKEGTLKTDPSNQEIEIQNQGIDAVQNQVKVSKKKPQKKSQEDKEKGVNSGIKSQKNIMNSNNQQNGELNIQEQNNGMQGNLNVPLKFEQQSLFQPGDPEVSSEISKLNKGEYFAPPEKKKRDSKPRQKSGILNIQPSGISMSDRRTSLVVTEQMSSLNKLDEQNMSLNSQVQIKSNNNIRQQTLKLTTQEEMAQFLSSFYIQFQLSRLPVQIENIGNIDKILETNKDMQDEDKRKVKNQNIVAFQIIKRLGRSNREVIDRRCAELQDVFGLQSGKVSYFLNSQNQVIYNTFNYANPDVLNYFGMVDSEMSQRQTAQIGNNSVNVEQESNDGNNQLRKDQKAKAPMGVQKDSKLIVPTQQQSYFSQKQEKLRQIIRQPLEFQEKKRKKRRLLNSNDHALWTQDMMEDDEDELIENDSNFQKSLSSLKQKMERKQKEKEKQLKMQQKLLLEQQKQKERELQAEKMLAQQILNGQQGEMQQEKAQEELSQQPYQLQLSQHQVDQNNNNYQPYFSQQFQADVQQQPNYYYQNQNQLMFNQPPEIKHSSSSFFNPNQMHNNNINNDTNNSMLNNLFNYPQQLHPLNEYRINQNYDQRNGFNQMIDGLQSSPGQGPQLHPENLQIQRDPSILNLNSQLSNENQIPSEPQLLQRKSYDGDQIGQGFYQENPFSIYQTNENGFRKNEEPNRDGGFNPQLFNGIPNQQQQIDEDQDINDYLNGDEEQQEQQQFQINDDF